MSAKRRVTSIDTNLVGVDKQPLAARKATNKKVLLIGNAEKPTVALVATATARAGGRQEQDY